MSVHIGTYVIVLAGVTPHNVAKLLLSPQHTKTLILHTERKINAKQKHHSILLRQHYNIMLSQHYSLRSSVIVAVGGACSIVSHAHTDPY